MRNVIWAASYQSVFLILDLVRTGTPLHVITPNPNLNMLLIKWHVSVELVVYPKCSIWRPLKILEIREFIRKYSNQFIPGDEVYFSHNSSDYWSFAVLQRWSQMGGRVLWKNLDPLRNFWSFTAKALLTRSYYIALLDYLVARIWMNTRLTIMGTVVPIVGISEKIAQKNGYVTITINNPHQYRKQVLANAPESLVYGAYYILPEAPIAFLNYYEAAGFWDLCFELSQSIAGAAIKLHPSATEDPPSGNWSLVPNYLPAELLLEGAKCFVGVFSTALIAASHNQDVCAISLANLVKWHSESACKDAVDYLKREMNQQKVIYFPKTKNELYALIREAI